MINFLEAYKWQSLQWSGLEVPTKCAARQDFGQTCLNFDWFLLIPIQPKEKHHHNQPIMHQSRLNFLVEVFWDFIVAFQALGSMEAWKDRSEHTQWDSSTSDGSSWLHWLGHNSMHCRGGATRLCFSLEGPDCYSGKLCEYLVHLLFVDRSCVDWLARNLIETCKLFKQP